MKNKFMFLILMLIVAIATIGCSSKSLSTKSNSPSWVDHYQSLSDLTDKSDLIIKAKNISSTTEQRVDMIFTKEVIKASKVYKGNLEINGSVVVLQTGGIMNGIKTEPFDEAPLLDKNGEYLLFLKLTPEGHYLVMGGYQGVGKIKNGKLSFNDPTDVATKEINFKNFETAEQSIIEEIKKSSIK